MNLAVPANNRASRARTRTAAPVRAPTQSSAPALGAAWSHSRHSQCQRLHFPLIVSESTKTRSKSLHTRLQYDDNTNVDSAVPELPGSVQPGSWCLRSINCATLLSNGQVVANSFQCSGSAVCEAVPTAAAERFKPPSARTLPCSASVDSALESVSLQTLSLKSLSASRREVPEKDTFLVFLDWHCLCCFCFSTSSRLAASRDELRHVARTGRVSRHTRYCMGLPTRLFRFLLCK